MNDDQLERIYLRHPVDSPGRTKTAELAFGLKGLALAPVYLGLGCLRGAPGVEFRMRCAKMGLRQLLARGRGLSLVEAYRLLVFPMDSVRYFEFDFAWRRASGIPVRTYLDVSSPRLLPLLFVCSHPELAATLVNPDRTDLPLTKTFAEALGVRDRCRFSGELIESLSAEEGSIDLITCISVLEHIPGDQRAIRKMWSLLRPGGRLLLTVPCAATAAAEYTDRDKYGLLGTGEGGFVFWQRYYDSRLLSERLFREIGMPTEVEIYGEKVRGSYARNVQQKMRQGWRYPGWREPYLMAREFRHFGSIAELPGMGVIGLVFTKPQSPREHNVSSLSPA
jgi:SAM-dependent methyltransferase